MAGIAFQRLKPGRERIALVIELPVQISGERGGLFVGQVESHSGEVVRLTFAEEAL